MTALEVAANAVTTLSILLAGRNSVHTWWTGIVGCVLFALLFFQSQLYADVTLQAFFVATSAWGWWQWLHGGAGGDERPITQAPRRWVGLALGAGIAATAAYGALLDGFTDAYAPFVDSAVLAFSVVAQLLLMQRRVTAWPFWLLVNTIACPLYANRGLYLTAGLYALYGVNAVVAWRHWLRLMRELQAEAAA